MLNRSALSTSIPPAIAPAISPPRGENASPFGRIRWMRMVGMLRLPSTLRGYVAFLASLLVLAFTMTLHIMLSAEIMRLSVQLSALNSEFQRVERYNANIIWEISGHSSLVDLHEEALAAGYINTMPTEYVNMPAASAFAAPALGPNATAPVGAQGLPANMGAVDATVSDPAAPQPQFVVISGEPATSDSAITGQAAEDGTVAAPRIGALANAPAGATQEPAWWEGYVPEWLRLNRVGDAVDETLDWIRERMPSGEWLQERW